MARPDLGPESWDPPSRRDAEKVAAALHRWREREKSFSRSAEEILHIWESADLIGNDLDRYRARPWEVLDDRGGEFWPPLPDDDRAHSIIWGWLRAGLDEDFLKRIMLPLRKSTEIDDADKWAHYTTVVESALSAFRQEAAGEDR